MGEYLKDKCHLANFLRIGCEYLVSYIPGSVWIELALWLLYFELNALAQQADSETI